MTLKIWEKNYILTMALLLLLLFGSLFFIWQYSFYKNLSQVCERAFYNESRVESLISGLPMGEEASRQLSWHCKSLQRQNIGLQIKCQEEILADSRPFEWDSDNEKVFQIVQKGGRRYACIANSYRDIVNGTVSILYMEEISSFYQEQGRQMILLLAFGIFTALFLSIFLYRTMGKIYGPINNIAHELRTPLTAIQGYSQYLLLGNISEEDQRYAGTQIDVQAQHMNELIENLLIMGNLRGGRIHMEHIEAKCIVEEMKGCFPFLSIEKQEGSLYGDKTLLISLLRNLVLNTGRHGNDICMSVCKNMVVLRNKEDYLGDELLDALNKGRPVPREGIRGKGLGLPLCREIIKMHHGVLQYQNLPGGGLEIQAVLWATPAGIGHRKS